jgi:hypothetical protein
MLTFANYLACISIYAFANHLRVISIHNCISLFTERVNHYATQLSLNLIGQPFFSHFSMKRLRSSSQQQELKVPQFCMEVNVQRYALIITSQQQELKVTHPSYICELAASQQRVLHRAYNHNRC